MFSVVPAVVALYFLLVGIFVVRQNRGNLLAKTFCAICVTTFSWQFVWSILYQTKNPENAYLLTKIGWIFILFLPTTAYHFLITLSNKKSELKFVYFSYLVSALFLFTLPSDLMLAGVYQYYWGFYPKAGILHPLHVLQTVIVVLRGLYVTYLKQKTCDDYKTKSQLRYCVVAIFIFLIAAIDYLGNYGLNVYPFGIAFLSTSLTIICYAIVQHRILDLDRVFILITARIVIYLCFLGLFVCYGFFFLENDEWQNFYFFIAVAAILVLVCETYSYVIRRVENLLKVIMIRRKESEDWKDLLIRQLNESYSLDQLYHNMEWFSKNVLEVNLTGFFIRSDLRGNDNSSHYFDLLNRNYFAGFSRSFASEVLKSKAPIERIDYPKELEDLKSSKVFVPFIRNQEISGFMLVDAKKSLQFQHYEIFNLLISQVALTVDRILAYQEISLQKQELQKQEFIREKAESLRSLAGSVAHELRNPLGVINSAQTQINLVSRSVKSENLDKFKDKIQNLSHIIAESVVQANDIINLTLSDVTGKKFSSDQIINIDAKTVINEIVEKFGYENSEQKNIIKIKIDSSNSFNFKANHERFSCIASNLIQNSLYYLKDFANLNITIGTEQKDFLGQKYNVIYFLDNGPGIKTENLQNIFNDFYTEGKNNGTGLGLSFCKRNMKAFGGDIICESQLGNEINGQRENGQRENGWTKFSLLFPQVS